VQHRLELAARAVDRAVDLQGAGGLRHVDGFAPRQQSARQRQMAVDPRLELTELVDRRGDQDAIAGQRDGAEHRDRVERRAVRKIVVGAAVVPAARMKPIAKPDVMTRRMPLNILMRLKTASHLPCYLPKGHKDQLSGIEQQGVRD
jgi:hypothetical protein